MKSKYKVNTSSKGKADRMVDGYKFDSKHERDFYLQFIQGKDVEWEFHPRYVIQESFVDYTGKKQRAVMYEADFLLNGVVIDVKGMATPMAKLKRKMFMKNYPDMELKWVVKNKKWGTDGWIDYDELQKIRRENKKKKGRCDYV